MKNTISTLTFLGFLFTILLTAQTRAADSTRIVGAGATFPYPLYSKWFSDYRKVDPSIQIDYQSIGSGAGIRQLLDGSIDFGASDAPMTDEQLSKAKTPVLHIPTVMGAVVLSYQLPGLGKPLQLTPELIAGIFMGKITEWNDGKIAAANPGVKLPALPILVAYRSDGSGTTAIFTDYLAKVNPDWSAKVGKGTSVNWPTGQGGKGNEGVAGLIKQTEGTLGYIELIYAEKNNLPHAAIQNSSGAFIHASMASVTEAAAGALKSIPDDFRVSITNSAGKAAYPISGFTYLLVPSKMPPAQGAPFVKFLAWAISENGGQKDAGGLSYAPLPTALAQRVAKTIQTIRIAP